MAEPNQRVAFTRSAADRIANVVRTVEGGDRAGAALTFGSRLPVARSATFRIATFTGEWSINALKTVTFKYQTTTPNTASARNLFATVNTAASGTKNCAIAKDGTAWFLIAAEC